MVSNYRVDSVNKEKDKHNVGQEYQQEKKIDDDDVSCGGSEYNCNITVMTDIESFFTHSASSGRNNQIDRQKPS